MGERLVGNYLDSFVEIKTEEDINKFLFKFMNFHDSILKEVHILNSGYVENDLSMAFGKFDLRILLQRQYKDGSTVELLLSSVREMKIENSDDIYGAIGKMVENQVTGDRYILLDFDGNIFKCQRVLWKERSNGLGIKSRFGSDFNVESFKDYENLEDGWVICKRCFEAWKPNDEMVMCPSCYKNRT